MHTTQLIFVVETDDNTLSDDVYINKLIREYYDLRDNDVKTRFVHMNGKKKYNKRNVLAKIKYFKDQNKKGNNVVIYCFDTDRIDRSSEEIEFCQVVKKYCKNNNYELIWFCYDIESVFIGKQVSNRDKKNESIKYGKRCIDYDASLIKRLSVDREIIETNHKSNILSILNKYLKKR